MEFTHIDQLGHAKMVDVGDKEKTKRVAVASGIIHMKAETIANINEHKIGKGNVLTVAKVAGIMAAKKTSELIPMCHQVPLDSVDIEFKVLDAKIECQVSVHTSYKTGVEMEALVGCNIALTTIYDMVKAVDKTMRISDVKVIEKTGGKSGDFKWAE